MSREICFFQDQQDVVRQTELVHRHSVVVNNMTGANITPPDHTDPIDDQSHDRLSPHAKVSCLITVRIRLTHY